MNTNEALITKFYTAFQQKDYKTMGECYHPEAMFKDEAFDLKTAEEVRNMWEMLCKRGKDFKMIFSDVKANDTTGSTHWEASYVFGKTGRRVYNKIDAEFEFRDGLIYRHRDHFSFYKWSRQSLGMIGLFLGWSGYLRSKVQTTAMEGLHEFMKQNAQG